MAGRIPNLTNWSAAELKGICINLSYEEYDTIWLNILLILVTKILLFSYIAW